MTYGLAALAAGYLLGGFPTAYLLARARGRDVFAVGSGSMGAMNTARNVSPALGAAVLVVDAAKGALAAYLGALLGGLGAGPGPLLGSLLGSLGAVTGHCFSPFVGFRGGKGLATAFGALLVVHPAPALYGLALLAVLALLVRDSDAAMAAVLVVYPAVVLLALTRHGWETAPARLAAGMVAVMCLVGLVRLAVGRRRARPGAERPAG
ncbi:MAG TPA: glycerol-3-phosphate acyltransferase [Trueperaceae bacterium]|nr:glycerol-3-phosphate acyltransferase [Trueperaceae bacterium]